MLFDNFESNNDDESSFSLYLKELDFDIWYNLLGWSFLLIFLTKFSFVLFEFIVVWFSKLFSNFISPVFLFIKFNLEDFCLLWLIACSVFFKTVGKSFELSFLILGSILLSTTLLLFNALSFWYSGKLMKKFLLKAFAVSNKLSNLSLTSVLSFWSVSISLWIFLKSAKPKLLMFKLGRILDK